MTDQTSPAQRALDLLVYAPTGLLLTVVEELPQLASKGRRRIEGQVTTARVVGQFSVQFARQQIQAHWPRSTPATPAGPAPTPAMSVDPAPTPAMSSRGPASGARPTASGAGRAAGSSRLGQPHGGTRGAHPETVPDGRLPARDAGPSVRAGQLKASGKTSASTPPSGSTPRTVTTPSGPGLSGDAALLGIPGYDSLSASQVVQRLPGLSLVDLRRVRDHEASHRHRRTILNRAEQLLDAEGAPDGARGQAAAGEATAPVPRSAPDGTSAPRTAGAPGKVPAPDAGSPPGPSGRDGA